MRYEDGTRDCPGCETNGYPMINRVRGDSPFMLCQRCERVAHNDAMSAFAEMQPYLRRRLAFTDWLIEHGQDIAA